MYVEIIQIKHKSINRFENVYEIFIVFISYNNNFVDYLHYYSLESFYPLFLPINWKRISWI